MDDLMRIGLFTSDFPFKDEFALDDPDISGIKWGGVAEVVYQMALSLNASGHSVKVFTASPTRKDIVQKHEDIEVFRYGKDLQVAATILSTGLVWKPLRHDLDLVHGHLGTPPGAYAASFYSRRKGRPLVLTIHTPYNETSLQGASLPKRASLRLFMGHFCMPMLERADAITSVSGAVLDESPYYRQFIHRTTVIPNGVSIEGLSVGLSKEDCRKALGIPEGKKVVLFVGSLSTYKNPEILLNAFGRLERDDDNLLVMIGDGPLRESLMSSAKRLDIEDRVWLPGFVTEREKRLHYKAADLLVLPSLAEAFPLVLLEAAAFSLPVIVSDIDVLKAVVEHGSNGLVFRGGVEEDLRLNLEKLLDDDELRSEIGRNARAFAEGHDWSRILERYGQIYGSLVH